MQAQHQEVKLPRSVQAQVARLVLQANLAYSESNSPELPFAQRLRARQECREYLAKACLLYTSPSPRDRTRSRMPSSA